MLINDNQYLSVIESIKSEISKAQYNAVLQVNKEMTMLYYHIGGIINEHKSWGNKFIDNLAKDIKSAYPNSTGYSVRNLKYMAKFATEYTDAEFVQQVVAQIPWGQNIVLLDKITDKSIRRWYIEKTIENGWSRNVLVHQIESGLYERQAMPAKNNTNLGLAACFQTNTLFRNRHIRVYYAVCAPRLSLKTRRNTCRQPKRRYF